MIDKIGNSHEELVDMIDSIEALGMLPPEYFADLMVCIDTHKELITPKVKVKREVELKEYIFSFENGGWNTVWAKTKRGAIKAALKEYDNNPESSLSVRVSSVSKATRKGLETACRSFY
jgi:hypothetical protein|tara:strand:- start:97 stop:453 length:357 start_codon:yes stop_codon:yes gene_type:complete